MNRTLVVAAAVALIAPVFGQAPAPFGTSIQIPVSQQAWQIRRAQTMQTISAVARKDPDALKAFDAILTQFEAHPINQTPLENLDLMGEFYIPKDGVETALPVVVMNSVLGWYDALRFGSASGRAEIATNEDLFARAYRLGGPDVQAKVAAFFRENPDKVRREVAQGIAFAEKWRNATTYDRHWPSAFGMERIINAQGGSSAIVELPANQWDKAWDEAKGKVRTFYGLSETGGSEASKYFPGLPGTALAEAIAAGDMTAVDKLIAAGADVNQVGLSGVTPLFWALLKGRKGIFDDLLAHGANPNAQLTETVHQVGAGNSVVAVAAMHSDIEYLRIALRHGGDPNLVNTVRSQTPLGASLYSMRLDNAKLLIASGAHLNWQDRTGDTPLILATTFNQYELVYLMLEAGADPGITDQRGATLLTRMNRGRTDMESAEGQWKMKVYALLASKGIGDGKPPSQN